MKDTIRRKHTCTHLHTERERHRETQRQRETETETERETERDREIERETETETEHEFISSIYRYRSKFSHDKETATPGVYSVHLDTYGEQHTHKHTHTHTHTHAHTHSLSPFFCIFPHIQREKTVICIPFPILPFHRHPFSLFFP